MVEENWVSYVDKVKRYFKFSIEEKRDFLIAVIVVGFIYSFRDWGLGEQIDVGAGFANFILTTIIVALALFVHAAMQRLHALRLGYKPEFIIWSYGLIGSVLVCLLTNGVAVIPLYGGSAIHMMEKHRLGHFRYGLNMVNLGLVAFTGPLSNLLFAYIIKIINIGVQSAFLEKMILINLLIAVWTMLPIPPVIDGVKVFFWSRMSYAFLVGVVGSAAILIWFSNNIFFILVGSLLVGAILFFLYYIGYEETGFYQ